MRYILTILVIVFGLAQQASAIPFNGVEFPMGEISFADAWVDYDPSYSGGDAPKEIVQDPTEALGVPDYPYGAGYPDYVALGDGGMIVLRFVDNYLIGSGDDRPDLWIFEIGTDLEDMHVAISTDNRNWVVLDDEDDGDDDDDDENNIVASLRPSGWPNVPDPSGAGIDIDPFIKAIGMENSLFSYVRIIDDRKTGFSKGDYTGADIDAVGAITTAPVPEPATIVLLLTGGLLMVLLRRKAG